ncbi:hypothetical protein TNCV_2250071 [Trichonephila clavipes]|nr:hypothetical protein TNCV_2250071 [Trichonephila clavipes]
MLLVAEWRGSKHLLTRDARAASYFSQSCSMCKANNYQSTSCLQPALIASVKKIVIKPTTQTIPSSVMLGRSNQDDEMTQDHVLIGVSLLFANDSHLERVWRRNIQSGCIWGTPHCMREDSETWFVVSSRTIVRLLVFFLRAL